MVPWDSHESQNVIEAKRKEMHRFKRLKVFRVVTRESMDRGRRGEDDQHQVGQARPCGTRTGLVR